MYIIMKFSGVLVDLSGSSNLKLHSIGVPVCCCKIYGEPAILVRKGTKNSCVKTVFLDQFYFCTLVLLMIQETLAWHLATQET